MTASLDVVHEVGSAVRVGDERVELLRYVYDADDPQVESPRPYFHPLRTRDGDIVTAYRPWDHVWHKGISLSLPHLGRDNFWGGPTFVRDRGYVQLPNNGAMRHRGKLELDRTAAAVDLRHSLEWIAEGGDEVLDEARQVRVSLVDAASWALLFVTRWRNVSGDTIRIGSPTTEGRDAAGYGGFFWRAPRSFTGAQIHTAEASGGDETMGARSPWAAIVGQHDETARWSGVVMVDDSENVRHPVQWFARSTPFACLCPAPFFDREYEFGPGAELTLRYAVLIHAGRADRPGLTRLAVTGQDLLAQTR